MISWGRLGNWLPVLRKGFAVLEPGAPSSPLTAPKDASSARLKTLPSPAIRWVAQGKIALRLFHFDADADAICGFQEETYTLNFPNFDYTPDFARAFRHDLRRAFLDSNNALFVLDDGRAGGNIVGFLWIVLCQNNWSGERFGYVNNLYVAPAHRGCGLGKELVHQGDDWFRSRGIKRIRLSVTTDNLAATNLYEHCGYKTQRFEMEKEL